MRSSTIIAVAIATLALAITAAGVVYSKPKAGQIVTVRVMRAKVMKAPRFIGATAGAVSRGDKLTFRAAKGDWYQVDGVASGWIHRTNVVDKAVQLSSKPGGSGGGASRDEVELAGRGFTPQVEREYRGKNPTLDFSHVDAMEQISVDLEALAAFVTAGELAGGDQ
jgi:hypothetical protein